MVAIYLRSIMAGKFKLAFGSVVRSLHQLWLEVTGTCLIAFAAIFGYHAVKEYRKYGQSDDSILWVIAAAGLSLVTLSFGIHSFWKARKLH
jgi:uncharacterized membrane protein